MIISNVPRIYISLHFRVYYDAVQIIVVDTNLARIPAGILLTFSHPW